MDDFIYTKDINEIKPMTLNLTLSNQIINNKVKAALRKGFTIDLNNPDFWVNLFSASLEGKSIKANVIISFDNKFTSACKLNKLGLLKKGTKIKYD